MDFEWYSCLSAGVVALTLGVCLLGCTKKKKKVALKDTPDKETNKSKEDKDKSKEEPEDATAKEDGQKKEKEDSEGSKTKVIVVTETGKEEEKQISLDNNADHNQQAIKTLKGVTYKATKDDDTLTGVSSLKDTQSKDDAQTNDQK